ncbi:MAG: tRNA pseudouridine(38-40) synthase TruA [Fidelibacterota bacterium]|nr:MAG: tRNA pseudouridine(38-40) synthase TruA [Candidatus Neomarinimicrobiota bacterium]
MGVLNFKLLIEYDGTAFHGWQLQRRERTIQADLEAALKQVTTQQKVTVTGAGRTDAGVHARGQVANVKLDTTIPPEQLRLAVNSQLAEDIRVKTIEVVPDVFHARKSAVVRRYSYAMTAARPVLGRQYVWPVRHSLNRDLLLRCAGQVTGEHDFAGFARTNANVDSTICRVEISRWELSEFDMVYHIAADRFLHHMVRYLVGTMVEVARGRYTVEQFCTQIEEGPGYITVYRAPARGLVLEEVSYPLTN